MILLIYFSRAFCEKAKEIKSRKKSNFTPAKLVHADSAELINTNVLRPEDSNIGSADEDPFFNTSKLLSQSNQTLLTYQSPDRGGTTPLDVRRSSIEMLSILAESAKEEQDKLQILIEQLKSEEAPPSISASSTFRLRRLTYDRKDGDENMFSPNKTASKVSTTEEAVTPKKPTSTKLATCIYASSEIGELVKGIEHPPFPLDIMGTYSCHGIEPAEEDEEGDEQYDGDDDCSGGYRSGIRQKINQDRGCVAHPYNGSNEQALFMVLDGHGAQGDLVSEFVMRQIVVSLEKVKILFQ